MAREKGREMTPSEETAHAKALGWPRAGHPGEFPEVGEPEQRKSREAATTVRVLDLTACRGHVGASEIKSMPGLI